MANTTTTTTKTLNESIISIRVSLQNTQIEKSGKSNYGGFKYFELKDFLPALNELMEKENVNDIFTIENGNATLTLIKADERQSYTIPFIMFETPINDRGKKQMQDIQYLGALNTYYKRYLYINAFGITDGDIIDNLNPNEETVINEETGEVVAKKPASKGTKSKATSEAPKQETKKYPEKLVTVPQIKLIQSLYSDEAISKMLKSESLSYCEGKLEKLYMKDASNMIEFANKKKESPQKPTTNPTA